MMMSYMSSFGSMLAFAVSCAATPAPPADAPEEPPVAPDASPEDPDGEAPDEGAPDAPRPDEAPPGEGDEAPDASPEPPPEPTEPEPAEPEPAEPEPPPKPKPPEQKLPSIEATEPAFINGEVPKVDKFLSKQGERVAACVLKHGGVTEADGLIKMQFLVRMRGRAEGVEVLSARGVTEEAQRCARKRLKNEYVGIPTADPTGVQFTYRLKRRLK